MRVLKRGMQNVRQWFRIVIGFMEIGTVIADIKVEVAKMAFLFDTKLKGSKQRVIDVSHLPPQLCKESFLLS